MTTADATDTTAGPFRVVILMPVYRDWESASLVCRSLDEHLGRFPGVSARVLLVDDGSPDDEAGWDFFETPSLLQVDALRLRTNLGHQRAICAGLCYVHEHLPSNVILVMDGDGEDSPEDAVRLIETMMKNPCGVVFAERRKRFEGLTFRAGYWMFRVLHRFLTGVSVRVGNFSIVSFSLLGRLTCMPELWNHYAGAVFKSKVPFRCVPMNRGRRLRSQSRMDTASLVAHGLAGIATFQEAVATRILIANAVCLVLLLISLAAVASIRLWTNLAIPGWATYTVGLIVILFAQILAVSFSLVFFVISNRSRAVFVPIRDCPVFIDRLVTLASRK
jgi:polyisoprenyl-phosphate glycosyltransferase